MATYKTASKQLLDNYACISTLEGTQISVGDSVIVASLGSPFNGTFTVLACPQYLYAGVDGETGEFIYNTSVLVPNQILYAATGSDVEFVAIFTGTVAFTPTCTWVTVANLVTYLGVSITNPSDDYTLATQAVSAGNQFCSRRRAEAGYDDDLTTSPSGDVTLGSLMYCAALWRSRGSLENVFASFEGMGSAPQQSLTPIVKQLLGIDRPQVA
jgi:peroxiredoxin